MSPADREQVRRWIAARATLAEVEAASAVGLCGNQRFTERARRLYIKLWTWGAPRYGGIAGKRQDWAYAWGGHQFLHNRIERCKRIAGAL